MAVNAVCLLLLLHLTLFVHGVTSLCNVNCSTDYDSLLNCSCSAVPAYSVVIEVKCRGEDDEVHGECEVKPPQSWCIMHLEDLYNVASVGTTCASTVRQQGDQVIMSSSESSSWALSDVVKPPPPFDVEVTNSDGFYNITWNHDHYILDCVTYSVRDPDLYPSGEEMRYRLDHTKLQPSVNYTVDVKAKFCSQNLYKGPWSEWSSTVEWEIAATSAEIKGRSFQLGTKEMYLQKKLQLITYVPKPDDFFKPLYNNYGGNFKEWVKPVFSEYDYLRINSQVQMKSEKQHDILQWSNEKRSFGEDNEMRQGGHFLHMLPPHSNSLLFFQDGSSSQGTGHSTGHISIHTVTLSGEEEFEEEVGSQSSVNTLRSYQDGESFSSFGEDNREQAGFDLEEPQVSRLDRQIEILPHHENQISNDLSVESVNFQPHVQLQEPERVSLDSFVSNEHSEDGYPHVDLDTIDSGFGECSSPGASDSNIADQIDSFHEHKTSNSNYVKQWMICSTIQEDTSNSENELHETQ
ncbi:interleukin 21 receptor, tandem duplicate 1 [Symphorus nematophorus]